MHLSKKSVYALRALRLLTEAYGSRPLSVRHLAEQEDIPPKYLEQVLLNLKNKGVLVSARGKEGGYALRQPPDQTTLGDLIRAIDGPLAPIACASRTAPHQCPDCPYPHDSCWVRRVMLEVRDNISSVLDNITLAGIARDAQGILPDKKEE